MQITVEQLLELCKTQVEQGHGKRYIVISDDNEGNNYHGMFYGFTEIDDEEKGDYPIYDSQYTDPKDIIILG